MSDFRETLYENYFETQSGRRINTSLKEKLKAGWNQLSGEILPLLPQNTSAKILDIGCGFGEFLMLLQQKGYTNLHGIDISPEQVAKAHELGLQNIQQANAFDFLEKSRQQFDVITCIDLIEHFPKDELVLLLKKITKALKPGGIAIFRTPNMDAPFTATYAFGDFTHQSFLNYSSAMQLFGAVGFTTTKVLPSYIKVHGFLKETLRKFLWKWLTLNAKLSLFASGKSTREVLFTPNLIIVAKH